MDLAKMKLKLETAGSVTHTRYFVRCRLRDTPTLTLTLFADGRAIVQGTRDVSLARATYAKYVGI
jgi:adenylyltransferase/sulfurtransferase